jgi:DNA-binding NarL/FixJ family response regulator
VGPKTNDSTGSSLRTCENSQWNLVFHGLAYGVVNIVPAHTNSNNLPMESQYVEQARVPSGEMGANSIEQLTPRQKEVAGLLRKGYSYRQISENLSISLYTVRAHLHSVYKRLQVKSRGEAAAKMFDRMKTNQ